MKTRNLEEIREKVEQIRDEQGKPIDEKIKELVVGLQYCGIDTVVSCEGHLDHGFPYPWVAVPYYFAEKLAKVVGWQNSPMIRNGVQNENTWVIRPNINLRLMPEDRNLLLEELQKRAIEFGIFLQTCGEKTKSRLK